MAVLSPRNTAPAIEPDDRGLRSSQRWERRSPVILTRLDSRANGTRWRACSLSVHHTTFPQRRRKQRPGAAPHNHSDIVLPRTSTSILLAYAPSQSGSYSCTSRPLYSERPDALAPTHAQHYIQPAAARAWYECRSTRAGPLLAVIWTPVAKSGERLLTAEAWSQYASVE